MNYKILMPIGPESITAEQIHYATLLANPYNATITLLSVLHDDDYDVTDRDEYQRVVSTVDEVRDTLSNKGLVIDESIIVFGRPIDEIIEVSKSKQANLIILGSHEQRPGDKHLLGHIAEQVIRKSEIPVMVTKIGSHATVDKILCPIDFSEYAKIALVNAIQIAKLFHAHLDILTVVESARLTSLHYTVDVTEENNMRVRKSTEDMEHFLHNIDLSDVKHAKHVVLGNPINGIILFAEDNQIDIICLGSAGRSGLSKFLLGSTTEKIIRKLPTSFMVTKDKGMQVMEERKEVNQIKFHFDTGNNLLNNERYNDAITQYENCLKINDMHVPSMYKLAYIYEQLGDNAQHHLWLQRVHVIVTTLWDTSLLDPMRDLFYKQ